MKKKVLFIGGTSGGGVATINNEVIKIIEKCNNIEYNLIDTTSVLKQNKKIIGYFILFFKLFMELIKSNYDIVYLQIAQTGYLHQSIFLMIAWLLRKETIAHFHAKPDLNSTTTKKQLNSIIFSQRFITKMIVLTEASRNSLIKNGYKKKIFIIPNFINSKDVLKEVIPIKDKKYFLYIGRMHEQKGIFEILQISEYFKNEEFIFIGNYHDQQTEQKFSEEIKTHTNCKFLGPIFNNSKYDYINNSKFFIFPTLWVGEIFPLTLVEAMNYGCIPLVNPIGSIDEVIKDNKNGYFIKANDIVGTVKLITKLLKDTKNLQEVSNNAIKWANEKYTSNAVRDDLIKILVN